MKLLRRTLGYLASRSEESLEGTRLARSNVVRKLRPDLDGIDLAAVGYGHSSRFADFLAAYKRTSMAGGRITSDSCLRLSSPSQVVKSAQCFLGPIFCQFA